jgi:long-chain fatty acid transport protein
MKVNRLAFCLTTLAVGALPAVAGAQGFGLNEIGSCGVARQDAITAAPCADASMIFWNPAAPALAHGFSALAGGAAITLQGGFTQDTTGRFFSARTPTAGTPHVFLNYKLPSRVPHGDRVAIGFGAYVPYGLTSQWYPDFPGRFSALRASLSSIYFQPNLAIEVIKDRLSLGGGPVIGHSSIELRQSLDLSQQTAAPGVRFVQLGIAPGTEFGIADLKGSATAYGFNVGALAKITKTFNVGVRWLAALDFKYDNADATFQQSRTGLTLAANNPLNYPAGTPIDALVLPQFAVTRTASGSLRPQNVSTHIKHPGQVQAGIGYTGFDGTSIGVDYEYITWKDFQALPVTFTEAGGAPSRTLLEDYKNSHSYRAGLEHAFGANRMLNQGLAARLGFSYVQSPAPDVTVSPLLPDMDRYNYAAGVGIPLGSGVTLDASYLLLYTKGRRGRIQERTDPTLSAAQLNTGFYNLKAHILSLSLKAQY